MNMPWIPESYSAYHPYIQSLGIESFQECMKLILCKIFFHECEPCEFNSKQSKVNTVYLRNLYESQWAKRFLYTNLICSCCVENIVVNVVLCLFWIFVCLYLKCGIFYGLMLVHATYNNFCRQYIIKLFCNHIITICCCLWFTKYYILMYVWWIHKWMYFQRDIK